MLLSRVNEEFKKYKDSNHGEMPLYVIVSSYEFDEILDEIKQEGGYNTQVAITTYKGSKIIQNDAVKKGDLRLTNDLPETSS
jgi:hypothetical protein